MGFSSKTGISLASGFKYHAKSPLDLRRVVDTIAERDELVTINAAWEGMHVYVKADKKTYEYRGGTTWIPVLAGVMYSHPTYNAKVNGLYKVTYWRCLPWWGKFFRKFDLFRKRVFE